MKKIIATTMALVMAASMTACGSVDSSSGTKPGANVSDMSYGGPEAKTTTEAVTTMAATEATTIAQLAGGWAAVSGDTSLSANKNAKAAFDKATGALAGMGFEPLAVLGTQVVAGTNYCILCRGRATVPGAEPCIELVYIYEDLKGNAEITGSKTIIGSESLDGGWSANSGDTDIAKNADVKKAFEKVTDTLTGLSLEPTAYLGSQVVAGSNYLILCKATAAVPNAVPEFRLVTVYADLEGGAEMTDIDEISFGEYDGEASESEENTEEATAQLANPWAGYATVEEAANAANISFAAPDTLGGRERYLVQAMKGVAEVRYGTGSDTTGFRKGTGTDDISGDYNTYNEISTAEVSGADVTLRGNDGKVFGAIWNDGTYSYAYYADGGVSIDAAKADIAAIIAENN
ncbi:MAG: hypothetical protein IKO47_13030 [Ruminococcus sp.]|nr:hypothetical protein [Ruminococcus sp.]